MQKYQQLDLFYERLQLKPHCTNDFENGLGQLYFKDAVARKYIEPNTPMIKGWLVFDIDRPHGGDQYDWASREAPVPSIVAENPENKHAHLLYALQFPIVLNCDDMYKTTKQARYGAAVELALMQLLDADPRYSGFTCKNPLHQYWNVRTYYEYLYTLNHLAEYLNLEKIDARKKPDTYGLGRNIDLFYHLRRYAYYSVKKYWNDENNGFEQFRDDLTVTAAFKNNNLFPDNPLHYSEFQHIIKSVAKWTWNKFSPQEFRAIQKARNVKSQKARGAKAEEKSQQIMLFNTMSIRQIARETGISRSTVHRLSLRAKTRRNTDMVNGTLSINARPGVEDIR